MHHPGGTIEAALNGIESHQFVLPAIQREFVWQPEQVCNLFDSLMQGFPFGEFMYWKVEAQNSSQYRWYDFVRKYHEKNSPHCPELGVVHNRALTAVLDGQQRLTAFNIGLKGSMAKKLPHLWWSNPSAFPERVLALDLLAPTEPDEEGRRYQFEFIDERRVGSDGDRLWYHVSNILDISQDESGPQMMEWLLAQGLQSDELSRGFRTLDRLFRAIRVDPVVAWYEETTQDIERVLQIFIRCNSGGTPLSYSNLLLSIAVSQWDKLDARAEVHGLVDELNDIRDGLRFNADFVLKAGLMLTDIASVGFRVENFTHKNMAILEENWQGIKAALLTTAQLMDSFGYDSRTIRAMNALLPIAYYLYRKQPPDSYVTSDQFLEDRRTIKNWLTRSILKQSGIWGSGLDTLLTALREVIRNLGEAEFPAQELGRVMTQRRKGLEFQDEEIDDLADMRISDSRMFPLLSMLFPYLGARGSTDIDHVFPRTRFTTTRLNNAGIESDAVEQWQDWSDRLANLQLLDSTVNNEKRAVMPAEWLDTHCPDPQSRQAYVDRHLLGDVPEEMAGFERFFTSRREALRDRLPQLVNAV
ncbi:MAG: DUF262 domain-containing protein [Chloroflexi bacterium]|nr:DUF262 domain-containing protein [Chloroflexota bacterium]